MSELDGFMDNLSAKLDSTSTHLIKQMLEVNGFTTRLSIKLISEKHLELMLKGVDLTMGAKSLLNYHIQVLRDESPLQSGKMKKAQTPSSPERGAAVGDQCATTHSKQVSMFLAVDQQIQVILSPLLKKSQRQRSLCLQRLTSSSKFRTCFIVSLPLSKYVFFSSLILSRVLEGGIEGNRH